MSLHFWEMRGISLFIAFAWKTKRFAFPAFLHLLLHDFFRISGNSEEKSNLQTTPGLIILYLIQYTLSEIHLWSVKCTAVTLRKNLEQHSIPFKWCRRLQWVDIYLFKLYSIMIILLLTNNLTHIYSETSKI